MATIIDALVVTLGLDGKQFASGAKAANTAMRQTSDEAKRRAAEIEASGKKAAEFFSKLRNEALALVAVFTAGVGIKHFVTDTIGGAAALGTMAKNLDMTTESLSAWEKANERAGGTAKGMLAQLQESAQELANVKMGRSSDAATEFYRMGGTDVRAMKDGNEFLLERSRILSDIYKKDPTRAMVVAGRMGINQDTFDLIKQGPAAVLALVDAQRKNSQITQEQAEQARKLANAWLDFRDRVNTVATQIVLRLAPSLDKIMKRLLDLANWVADHQDDIARWLDKAVDALQRFATKADNAAQSVGGWKTVLAGLLALKVAGFALNLATLAASLGGVAGAMSLISIAGPAALAALAGAAVYASIDDAPTDKTPMRKGEKVAEKPTDPNELPSWKEIQLRTRASLGNPAAAKELYKATGKNDYPAVWTPEKGETPQAPTRYKKGEGGMHEIIDRTLASLGNHAAAVRIRDETGEDDYNVGPAMAATGAGGGKQRPPSALFAQLEGRYKLPSGLLDRMWAQESGRGKYMVSPKNAKGHFGFMDPTAKEYGLKDPNDLGESADAAARMMRDLLKRNGGDLNRALAAYNWGQRHLNEQGLQNAPRETQNYMRVINPGGVSGAGPVSRSSKTEVNLNGPINITAPNGDVNTIATRLADTLKAKMMAAQSNTGLD